MAKKRQSSQRWLARQQRDPYVKAAQGAGYRSRAAYKLGEIDERLGLLRPGRKVLDLGAAPGGWSQVAADRVGDTGQVVAVDLLPIDPISEVDIVEGDILSDETLDEVRQLAGPGFDVIISDMAPRISGIKVADQAAAIGLAEMALWLCEELLVAPGTLIVKLFQGSGSEEWLRQIRAEFVQVRIIKPKASRPESREVYVVATKKKGPPRRD